MANYLSQPITLSRNPFVCSRVIGSSKKLGRVIQIVIAEWPQN
jgi:hypothetical protein